MDGRMKFSAVLVLAVCSGTAIIAQTNPAAPQTPAETPPAQTTPAPTTPAADENRVVLTVGDEKITAKEYDTLVEALPDQIRSQAKGPMKRQVAEQIARLKLLAGEARKRGLDKDESVQARIRFQEENMLAGAAFQDMVQKAPIDEAAVRQSYDESKSEFESVKARHILVKFKGSPIPQPEGKPELSEEEALSKVQEIRKRLTAGEDFSKLAKEESDDTGSGSNGGDLGTFNRGQMVPAFDEVAFKLPVGQVSEPVKTQFGYHLILVDSRDTKSFEDVRLQLEQKLRPEAARANIEKIRQEASVVLDEAYFGAPAAAPKPAPAAGPAAGPSPAAAK